MLKRDGFTIIELAVVIVVIALLATLGGLVWRTARDNAVQTKQENDITRLKSAIEKYYSDNGEYPMPPSCASNPDRVCSANGLASALVPKYLDAIPKNKDAGEFTYVVERVTGTPGSQDRYGFQVPLSDGTACKTGKNINVLWWGTAVGECAF